MLVLAFDTETFLFGRGNLAPELVCAQFCDGPRSWILTHDQREEIIDTVRSADLLIGQNLAYDLAVLMAYDERFVEIVFDKLDRDQVFDLMLAQQLLDIASGHYNYYRNIKGGYSLEGIAKRYDLHKDSADPWRLNYQDLYDVPLTQWHPAAVAYALKDVKVPFQIWEQIMGADTAPYSADFPAQARAALSLHLMSVWGVHTEPDAVEHMREVTRERLDSCRTDLQAAGIVREDGTRHIRAAQALAFEAFKALDMPPKWTAAGLKLSEDERAVQHISLDEDACLLTGLTILEQYSTYTSANNLKKKLDDLAQGYELPLQCRYNPLAETGRTSCTKPGEPLVGVQLQNMPREEGWRECFIPRPGTVFVGGDFSGAELHTFAQCCIDLFQGSELGKALNEGVDAHLRLAALILGMTYETAKQRKKEPEIKKARQEAKIANFGFQGGMGPDKFVQYARTSYKTEFTLARAKEIREKWFQATPEARLYFRFISGQLDHTGKGVIKQLRVQRWRGDCRFTDAANGLFQSLCADGAKAALYAVTRACYAEPESPLYGCRPWAFIHDEIIIEAPEGRVHEAGIEMRRLMEREFNRFVPDCPTTVDLWASDRWSKKAEGVWENDKLQVWRYKK